jgi:predicted AlkP superfamily phosphohydrolase/phosphomutase
LDAVPPKLLFEDLIQSMPNVSNMIKNGLHGTLTSCHPPITVPAWTVMMSSKDPGTLGIYGFRHRRGASYTNPWIVSSNSITHDRVWEVIEKYGKRSTVIGVPPAYPPYRIQGKMISCFLTPGRPEQYTYPNELKHEIEKIVSEYKFDVLFRTEDRDTILKEIYEMTEKRFEVIKKLIVENSWDFFVFMEIGTDRLHHAFWKFYDKTHPKYVPNNKYEQVIPEYYRYIDQKIGELLQLVDDATTIMVVSDHGTKGMRGAFCINEWLIKEGYLVLKRHPHEVTDIEKADINWEETTAWGWGGYYARIFLNVKGREPQGIINQDDYDHFIDDLRSKMQEIRDPEGRKMNTFIFKPEEIYVKTAGDKPDLMVYFDDLFWRSAGTIGHGTFYLSENDTGPDDSVHSMDGIFIIYNPRHSAPSGTYGESGFPITNNMSIYDIAPTILKLLDLNIPSDMQGKPLPNI